MVAILIWLPKKEILVNWLLMYKPILQFVCEWNLFGFQVLDAIFKL